MVPEGPETAIRITSGTKEEDAKGSAVASLLLTSLLPSPPCPPVSLPPIIREEGRPTANVAKGRGPKNAQPLRRQRLRKARGSLRHRYQMQERKTTARKTRKERKRKWSNKDVSFALSLLSARLMLTELLPVP